MIKTDIHISMDERGFVLYDGVKLPFKFLQNKQELEFVIKDKQVAEKLGTRFIRINLIDIQILSLIYPANSIGKRWECKICGEVGVSNFKGIAVDDTGALVILFECLHCSEVFTPFRPADKE